MQIFAHHIFEFILKLCFARSTFSDKNVRPSHFWIHFVQQIEKESSHFGKTCRAEKEKEFSKRFSKDFWKDFQRIFKRTFKRIPWDSRWTQNVKNNWFYCIVAKKVFKMNVLSTLKSKTLIKLFKNFVFWSTSCIFSEHPCVFLNIN